jgi:phosphatidylglycerol:prolipoprotein diacylglycerol transferase
VGPAIPYIDLPEWKLHFLSFITSVDDPPSIKPFGTLVAIGVYIGSIVAVRHARQRGLDVDKMNSFIFWVVGIGFIGGHVFDAIFYTPDRLAHDPVYIFKIWAGLSSFGGFLGAIIGAVSYKLSKRENILPYVDTVCSAFPLAWVFGRSGCASVHDHPGRITSAWFAVKPPDPNVVHHAGAHWAGCSLYHGGVATGWSGLPPGMGRLDLGLIEMVCTIPLAVTFLWLWSRKPRPFGFFAGWMCIAYAPVRFGLDFLRENQGHIHEADPRYFGLTPAQWACFGLVGLGIYIIRLGKNYGPVPATYEEAQELARAALLEQEGENEDEDEQPRKARKVEGAKKPGKGKKKKRSKARSAAASTAAETPISKRAKSSPDDESGGPERGEREAGQDENAEASDEGGREPAAEANEGSTSPAREEKSGLSEDESP